ncbi:MAG: HepT-like ribonuclease domain-containing protein [bacterium]
MEAIEKFVQDLEFDQFKLDDKTSSAVIRKLEIIGEATKSVPETIRQNYAQVPWKEMAGMRDKLIHFYFGIDYNLVWQAIKNRIPQIKPVIRQIIEDLGEQSAEK